MGRRNQERNQAEAKPEDYEFANKLLTQGLIPGGSSDRALAVLLFQDDASVGERPTTPSVRASSTSPSERQDPTHRQQDSVVPNAKGMLPRSWKQAEKIAQQQHKKPARPRTAGPSATAHTAAPAADLPRAKARKGVYSAGPKRSRPAQPKMSMAELEAAEVDRAKKARATGAAKRATGTSAHNTGPIALSPSNSVAVPERHYASHKARKACEERIERIGRKLLDLLADASQEGGLDMAYLRIVLNQAGQKNSSNGAVTSPGRAHLSHVGSDLTREVANFCPARAAEGGSGSYVAMTAPGTSLLHVCATWNLDAFAEVLLSRGALVNRANEVGETPLHWAAASNAYSTAALLLDFGADMTAEDASASCALTRAAHSGHLEIVSLLLARARGTVSANKLQQILQIARAAIEQGHADGAKEKAVDLEAKRAALVLIQRHLQMLRGSTPVGVAATAKAKHVEDKTEPAASLAGSEALVQQMLAAAGVDTSAPASAGDAGDGGAVYQSPAKSEAQDMTLSLDFDESVPGAAVLEEEIARLASQCEELRTLSGSAGAADSALVFTVPHKNHAKDPAAEKAAVMEEARGRSATTATATKKPAAAVPAPVPVLPVSAVSPRRNRVIQKFYSAGYVPFLHDRPLDALGGTHANGSTCQPGDVLIAVEQCAHCETHNFSLWHDAAKYNAIADRCMIALVRALLDKGFRVRLFALKEVPKSSRTGALEVTCSVRVGAAGQGRWVTTSLHSKLDSSSWPAVKRVASRGASFVQWALEEAGMHSHLETGGAAAQPSGVPLLRAILAEHEQDASSFQPETAATVPLVGPGSAMKKLQVEGQFMSWLIRLSMSSAGASPSPHQHKGKGKPVDSKFKSQTKAAPGIHKPSWDPLSSSDASQSLQEWTRGNIQSFGAFYNPFARQGTAARMDELGVTAAALSTIVGSGANAVAGRSMKRNAAAAAPATDTPFSAVLEPLPFEKLVLQHFFVFDNLSPAQLTAPSSPAPVRSTERSVAERFVERTIAHVSPTRAPSRSPERCVAEAFVLRTLQALTSPPKPASIPDVAQDVAISKVMRTIVVPASKTKPANVAKLKREETAMPAAAVKKCPTSPPKKSSVAGKDRARAQVTAAAASGKSPGNSPKKGATAANFVEPKPMPMRKDTALIAAAPAAAAATTQSASKEDAETSYENDTYEVEEDAVFGGVRGSALGAVSGLAAQAVDTVGDVVEDDRREAIFGEEKGKDKEVEEEEDEEAEESMMVEYPSASAAARSQLGDILSVLSPDEVQAAVSALSPASPLAAAALTQFATEREAGDSLVFSVSAETA